MASKVCSCILLLLCICWISDARQLLSYDVSVYYLGRLLYAPLFFIKIASINPDNFCKKVNLCEDAMHIPQLRQNSCDLCHQAMIEILPKLKDPDTQLDIIESLLKGCEKTEKFVKQCKKLVLEYGLVILANDEQLLENKDLCMPLHICKSPASKGASLNII